MTNNLTLVAALPSGGGCMSALPAEVNEAKKPEPVVQMKAAYFDELEYPAIAYTEEISMDELAKRYLAAHEGLME